MSDVGSTYDDPALATDRRNLSDDGPWPDIPSPADEARGSREIVGRQQRGTAKPAPAEPKPEKPSPESAVEAESPFERNRGGPQDDGPELLERSRLNMVNSYYKGTLAGAGALSAMARIYLEEDPPDLEPGMKEARANARKQYDTIVADLIAYDLMPSWSGLPQLGAAIGGSVAGALPSPESFAGWAAKGSTWVARTMWTALQQGLISGASDPVIQMLNMDAGAQHEYEGWQTVGAFAFGGALGAGFHAAGEGVGHLIGQRQLRKQLAELGQIDKDAIAADHARWAADPRNGIDPVVSRETEMGAPEPPKLEPFKDLVAAESERLTGEGWGGTPRKEKEDHAHRLAFERETADLLKGAGEEAANVTPEILYHPENPLWRHYDRAENESPAEALAQALSKWGDKEHELAIAHFDQEKDADLIADLETFRQAYERDMEAASQTGAYMETGMLGRLRQGLGDTQFFPGTTPPRYRGATDGDIPFTSEGQPAAGPVGRGAESGGAVAGQAEGTAGVGGPAGVRGGDAGEAGRPGGAGGTAERGTIGAEGQRGERVDGLPPPAAGMVRMYHGGEKANAGGDRHVSPNFEYARDFGEGGRQVWYVDVPENSAWLVDAADTTGTNMPRVLGNSVAPPEVMATAKSVRATERTAQGEQTLIPGVEPVTDRQRVEAEMAKPMRGGDEPAGGLFDADARAQKDLLDVQALMAKREGSPMPGEVRRDADMGIAAAGFTPEQTVAVKSLQHQALALADAIDFPLRQGRVQIPGAFGIYKGKSGVVRVKEIADFEVVKHEAGHAIEAKVGKELTALTQKNLFEMAPLDYDQGPNGQRANEGFAEWMRVRMQNPAAAQRLAPTFFNEFEALMAQKHPNILKILNDTAVAHRAWLEAPSADVVAAVVQNTIADPIGVRAVAKEIKDEGLMPTVNTYLQKAYQHMVDKFAPMERAMREMAAIKKETTGGLVEIKAAEDPSILIRSLRRSGQGAHVQLMFGIVPFRETAPRPGATSFKGFMNEALDAPFLGRWDNARVEKFDQYVAATMSEYLWRRYDQGLIANPPSPIKPGDARQFIAEMDQAFPSFKKAAQSLQSFVADIRKKKYDAGIWTKETYDKTGEYEFYVPMKRVFEGEAGGSHGPLTGESVASAVKARKGSERDIDSPLRNIMRDVFFMEQDIRTNEIRKALLKMAESIPGEGGKYAERLPSYEAVKHTAPLEEMMKARGREMGVDPDEVRSWIDVLKGTDEELTGSFWKMEQAAAHGEPVVFAWEGGKPVPIRVMSEAAGEPHRLYELMTEAPQPILDVWTNLISIGATLVRGGVVNNPMFIVTNYIKDQLQVALSQPGYVPFLGGIKGIFSEVTEGASARMRAYTGGVMGGSIVGEVERKFEADLQAMAKQGYWVQRVSSVRGALELMQITEAGTRNSILDIVYQQKLKQGLSPYEAMWEAGYRADDIMDFSRNGDRMNLIRRMVPFLNANIQGQDRYTFRQLVEPFFRKQVTLRDKEEFGRAVYAWTMAGAGGIALGMAYAAMNWEKEVYRDASAQIKGGHVVIPIQDGKVIVMPKPFELGIGFTFGEYAYAHLFEKDPRAAGEFAEALRQAMMPPDPIQNMPIVTPIIELSTNYSFFRKGPIVPDSVANRANPELEYNASTTSGARLIGETFGVSPMKVDYAMGSFFGTNGRDLMSVTSMTDKDSPTAALDDTIFVRRLLKDGERISGRVKQFWDLMAQKNGKYQLDAEAYRKLVTEATVRGQDPVQANELLAKLPAAERAYVIMSEGANAQGKPAFSADEKRMHPLTRAREAVTVLNGIARDLQTNTLVPYREKERLQLDPDQRRRLIDDIRTMAGAEMRNGFAVVGEPGYVGRPVYDTQDFMDVIAKVSPNVADEIATRYATAKIPAAKAVQEAWPTLRDDVTTYGSSANIKSLAARVRAQGYEFGAQRAKKPGPVRLQIDPAAVPASP